MLNCREKSASLKQYFYETTILLCYYAKTFINYHFDWFCSDMPKIVKKYSTRIGKRTNYEK